MISTRTPAAAPRVQKASASSQSAYSISTLSTGIHTSRMPRRTPQPMTNVQPNKCSFNHSDSPSMNRLIGLSLHSWGMDFLLSETENRDMESRVIWLPDTQRR
jgi:hypothetical protein